MLASLALITLLQAPVVGADGLALAQPRLTYGVLGSARGSTDIKPGDSVVLSFEIQGITTDIVGKAAYSTSVEVADASGKTLFSQPSRKFQEYLPLGGNTVPAFAQVDLGLDTPPGKYTMSVTVTDAATGRNAVAKQEFSVGPKGFDIVRVNVTGDPDGLVPLGAFAPGQPFWVHAAVTGFKRGAEGTKQPKVVLNLRVLDADQKPILLQPFTGTVERDVPANATSVPIRFFVPLNRAGNFVIQLGAKDEIGNENSPLVNFPINVRSK